ncbi:HAMP domain-containing sensor histidine kinase [Flavobacterium enshiense]|uniref:sensor histidine kinase n=1 Tax=Flavobacterium enshiense TaxID=1341165 RepID=UPI00345D2277
MNERNTPEEIKRLEILKSYEILDTDPESDYDNITFLASKICNVPISAITLVDEDRVWVKSKVGFDTYDANRNTSFCALAITRPEKLLSISDIKYESEFSDISEHNGFNNSGFYASVTLKSPDGYALGTLCVADFITKEITSDQLKALEILGNQISKLLELRKINLTLSKKNETLNLKYEELEQFARVVSHDIKSPLNNIISLIILLKESCIDKFDGKEKEFLEFLSESSYQLKEYVDGLLNYYKSESFQKNDAEEISIAVILEDIINVLDPKKEHTFKIPDKAVTIKNNKYAIEQILVNLISNGIKYNDKKPIIIEVDCQDLENQTILSVKDNGNGIEITDFETIFSFFKTLNKKDRFGNYGTGIGLATVKKIAEKLNGKIKLRSVINQGSEFTICFDK